MSISFVNKHGTPVSVCLVWYNPNCSDPPFRKSGWLNLAIGEGRPFLNGAYRNKYFYFYAEASDGSYWGDPRFRAAVINNRFDTCFDTVFEPNRIVPLHEIDTGGAVNFTVNLL